MKQKQEADRNSLAGHFAKRALAQTTFIAGESQGCEAP